MTQPGGAPAGAAALHPSSRAGDLSGKLVWLLLLPVALLLWGLGDFGLLNNVEGMYAEIGREMLAGSGWQHWVVPHLNGVPYIEKPPLLYWSIAVSMSLFGEHDWAVRLVSASAGMICLGFVYAYGRAMVGARFGFLAAFALGTSAGFVMMSKVAMTDALLSGYLTGALLLSQWALRQQRLRLLWAAMVCLALAVLAKGLVAFALYGLVWFGWLVTAGRGQRLRVVLFLNRPSAWGVFLLVVAPWHIAAALALPEFSWFYFINEHVLRFLGLRVPKDYYSGTPFYYLPRLVLMAAPWGFALLAGLARRGKTNGDGIGAFLWACVLAPLIFFSASSAKANYYVLVCLPGLALLAARHLERWLSHGGTGRLTAVLLIGVAFIPAEAWMLHYAAQEETSFSARQMAAHVAARQQAEPLPLFLFQDFEDYSALPFYLQSNAIGVVDEKSADLDFGLGLGQKRDPARYPSLEAFAARRDSALLLILDARVREGLPLLLAPHLEKLERVGNATLYRFAPGKA
ncbi:MAG TPA: glycosyltransferase family 39 protein [Rhodocyclaceae bacterium]|nr:glycosyltransferase family 39 protein [Rhodocyclaceae bacterium]